MTDGPRLAIPTDLEAALVLVRHGESELIVQHRFQGRLETPLSATGRRQAALVGARLARPHDRPALPVPVGPPLAIVHSPLGRAAETATAIATARDETAALRADGAFLEIGQGDWEGRLSSEIQAADGERLATWRRRPTEAWAPGGERLIDVRARVLPGLAAILAELAAAGRPGSIDSPQVRGYGDAPGDQPWTILVAHDGVFKVVLCTLFDLPLERFWMWSSDLCGISVIELRAGRPVIRAMNLTEHLAALHDEAAIEEAAARSRSGAL
ncbi:MAG TPA: histidine phosphatase family protein [Candidatus Limnocylindrales bacterium]|nr:histidine phosphatase family protein [Candidatus Limnocylindrales bacterium]